MGQSSTPSPLSSFRRLKCFFYVFPKAISQSDWTFASYSLWHCDRDKFSIRIREYQIYRATIRGLDRSTYIRTLHLHNRGHMYGGQFDHLIDEKFIWSKNLVMFMALPIGYSLIRIRETDPDLKYMIPSGGLTTAGS